MSKGRPSRREELHKRAWETFQRNTREHIIVEIVEAGGFRRVALRNPNQWVHHYALTTWPGHLAVTGDMGAFVFSRLPDMFQFFRGPVGVINPGYWAEKLVAADTTSPVERFDLETLREHLRNAYAHDPERLAEYLVATRDADEGDERGALEAIEAAGLNDPWDTARTQYSHRFLWICHAVVLGIAKYDEQAKPRGCTVDYLAE